MSVWRVDCPLRRLTTNFAFVSVTGRMREKPAHAVLACAASPFWALGRLMIWFDHQVRPSSSMIKSAMTSSEGRSVEPRRPAPAYRALCARVCSRERRGATEETTRNGQIDVDHTRGSRRRFVSPPAKGAGALRGGLERGAPWASRFFWPERKEAKKRHTAGWPRARGRMAGSFFDIGVLSPTAPKV